MELLVVISILLTLSAFLFPVYLRVRSRIDAISCANQLRQIGLAIRMYVHDLGDDTPYSVPSGLGKLYPNYIQDKDLLVCPYFRRLAPDVVEEMHQISLQGKFAKIYWHSYSQIIPEAWDSIARKNPGEVVSFSEVYQKRGDQIPIIYCDAHRYGCPTTVGALFITSSPKGLEFAKVYCSNPYFPPPANVPQPGILYSPNEPIIILRWNGSVHFVYKQTGLFLNEDVLLIDF